MNRRKRVRCLLGNDETRHAVASATAERGHASLLACPAELGQEARDEAAAGCTKRVPQGDCAALDVDLAMVDAEVAHRHEHLRRKGLIDLPQVDLLGRQSEALKQLRRGVCWADAFSRF